MHTAFTTLSLAPNAVVTFVQIRHKVRLVNKELPDAAIPGRWLPSL